MVKDKWKLIYNSWVKLFKNFWPKKVSIDMIVKEAWVGKGTFYNYYENKEKLYEKIVSDIRSFWKKYVTILVNKYPDPKERLMVDLLNSLDLFNNKKSIIWNLMDENKDFYLWNIDWSYLEKAHREMVLILFNDISDDIFKNDDHLFRFSLDLFWFYKYANSLRCTYKSNEEFKNFMTKLAYFFVEWLFNKSFSKIKDINYENYLLQINDLKPSFKIFKKY